MMNLKNLVVPNSAKVREEGIAILVENLGIAKTAIFIKSQMSQEVDYLEIKQQLFGDLTATHIYQIVTQNNIKQTS